MKKKRKERYKPMKNYYEILEVNPKASQEIIEKAYKVLVKRYHPDLYAGEKQREAEKKIKEINEAYQILSDQFLKEQYDKELMRQEIKRRQAQEPKIQKQTTGKGENQKQTNQKTKQQVKKAKVGTFGSMIELCKQLVLTLKNKQKREEIKEMTRKDVLAIVLTIFVVILLGIILWFLPFTNGWMRELLFENPIFNWIGGLFSK